MHSEQMKDLHNKIISHQDQCFTACRDWYKGAPPLAMLILMSKMIELKRADDPVTRVAADFALMGLGAVAVETTKECIEKEDEEDE